jgi:GntR family transcriptional repressor for pyruvate dehydrogenase complex
MTQAVIGERRRNETQQMSTLSKITIPKREPLATEVARTLLDYLFSGELVPGDRIPSERQLSEALGVSRPAVREGLRALSFVGLLEVRHSSGTYFRDPDQELLFSIFELSLMFGQGRMSALVEARSELEVCLTGLAAARREDSEVDELAGALQTMERSSGTEFVEADLRFHSIIAAAAKNEVLEQMLRGVRTMVRSWVQTNVRAAGTTRIAYDDHVPIFEGIRDRDVDAARSAMAAHMAAARRRRMNAADVASQG